MNIIKYDEKNGRFVVIDPQGAILPLEQFIQCHQRRLAVRRVMDKRMTGDQLARGLFRVENPL